MTARDNPSATQDWQTANVACGHDGGRIAAEPGEVHPFGVRQGGRQFAQLLIPLMPEEQQVDTALRADAPQRTDQHVETLARPQTGSAAHHGRVIRNSELRQVGRSFPDTTPGDDPCVW